VRGAVEGTDTARAHCDGCGGMRRGRGRLLSSRHEVDVYV